MYEVQLTYGNQILPIHNDSMKLPSGEVKQGINCIDSFSFTIFPNNRGFNKIHEFKTLISVYNTKRNKYEFQGRVLVCNPSMADSGLITKSVICESFLGYLQDTEQDYVEEQNWTPTELLTQLLNVHNSLLEDEPEKHFKVGIVFSDENIYIGIQRESTWECIMNKIIEKVGGEIQLRTEEDGMYIDIVEERGSTKTTEIALSKNMKSITQDNDPSSYITRLIPLGAKIVDDDEQETEQRIDISSVNDGKKYIEDTYAIKTYGIHIKHEYWDDVHDPAILKTKAINFLSENNKVLQKYSITALDLAVLGIDIDYIDVCNYYPVKNKLLGIDDTLRVITKTIDVVNESSTSFEIGDAFKTLLDLEIEKDNQINEAVNTIETIEKNYVTNQTVTSITNEIHSLINQTADEISSEVSQTYTKIDAFEQYKETVSTMFTQTNDSFNMTFTEVMNSITNLNGTVNANYQELIKYIRFKGGTITLGEVGNPLSLVLDNDRLSFLENGIEVAYVSNQKLYITSAEVLIEFIIGKFGYFPRENGSLDFKKVGD